MHWKWRLSHARGYRELGLFDEAIRELRLVPPEQAEMTEILSEHALLHQEMRAWPKLATVCGTLARRHPDDAGWWIMWAYGVRRSQSLDDAEKILLEAEGIHPENATIQFNLGCYACQLGNLAAAHARVKRAISLDPHFREVAQIDVDLEPLRESMRGLGS